jgi:hypothetical protein
MCGSGNAALALQAQSPEFKPQQHKKVNKQVTLTA